MTASKAERQPPLEIGGVEIPAGERRRFDIPAALLPTRTQLHLPLTVLHGLRAGPRVWLSAALHGDELNGVEIIARVLERLRSPLARGSLIAVPIVNVFGFVNQSRYLPDRRDLNRSFPGSARGSLAARIAHLFLTEIVRGSTHGIDLHTAAQDRSNLPQIRADLEDPETRRCAAAFGAPVMIDSRVRDGSLRAAAGKLGVPVLLYEAGEPNRFNAAAIDVGERGVLDVLAELDMIPKRRRSPRTSLEVRESRWVRARRGGVLRLEVDEGDRVVRGQVLGTISDPFGEDRVQVKAPFDGLVIGRATSPVIHGGDAVLHLAKLGP